MLKCYYVNANILIDFICILIKATQMTGEPFPE